MNLHLLIISFIEGLTEFLPISSTAHLIIASKFFAIDTTDSYIKFYLLFIQLGALLAGIILFSKKVLTNRKIFINICISFIPSAILGFIFYKLFKKMLEGDMMILASALLIGGLIFIYLEKFFSKKRTDFKDEISKIDAFIIGVVQTFAIIPGVSRSGATIVAGVLRGIKKTVIIEYTFLLALPTLGAAVLYDAYRSRELLKNLDSFKDLSIGFIVSFITALIVIYFLKKFISKISLSFFGYYRIILSILIFFFFMPQTTSVISQVSEKSQIAGIAIAPDNITPGDPVLVTVNASSSPIEILFDNQKLPIFEYENLSRALIAIPFEEIKMEHNVHVKLQNGMVFNKAITLTPREKIEKPLGIPEKLGGNTPAAGKALVDNLAIENQSINNIKTARTILWSKAFSSPLASLTITDPYGYNRDTVGYTIVHKGTDLRAPIGTEVRAMNSGIVRISRLYTVYGNSVIIDHGLGLSTLYMHLSELKVKEGDQVEKGQIIGLSGKTGYAEQPHLHVSIKVNGVSIDPMRFLHFFNVI